MALVEKRSATQRSLGSVSSDFLEDNAVRAKRSSGWWRTIAVCLCVAALYWNTRLRRVFTRNAPEVHWQGGVEWVNCGDNIDCGRLEVPLDYFNSSAGNASLALAKYRATNGTARVGTLLTNPGGPGGSGVNYIYRAGKRLSDLLDGRYDVVSWDPRGINGTLPRVECFASKTEQDIAFANTHQEILPDSRNLSDPVDLAVFKAGLKLADARNEAVAHLCHERSGEVLRHVGTATVVRDLERIYSVLEGENKPINFWGFSYGTVVGAYLVNMFPDRVGRVAIDGVVDPDLWANTRSQEWLKWDFNDTEKDLDNFYAACAEAGPGRCALAKENETASSISDQIDDLIARLYEQPIAVPHATRPGPLTSSMITTMLFTYLYRPRDWPTLASNLAAALEGNGTAIVNLYLTTVELNTTVSAPTSSAIDAVTCVDTPDFEGVGKEQALEDMLTEMIISQQQTSRHFSAGTIDVCHHWKARETDRFTGPFNHTLNNEILVIGNTADPITPVQNARAVNRYMPNSTRLIVQDGSGHCSSAMTSLCTSKIIRSYFLDGKLPESGVVCATDEVLFPPTSANASDSLLWLKSDAAAYSADDLRLLHTVRELGKELTPFISSFKRHHTARLV